MEFEQEETARSNPNAGSRNGGEEDNKKKSKGADGETEGSFLLGAPTFSDLDGARLRCVETGHELLARDQHSYSRSKACRLALIDAALASKRPPLNMFQPHPTSKSQLICNLTGDAVNKTEEHIWKHINGKRFLNKLEKMEMEKLTPTEEIRKDKQQSKKKVKPNIVSCKKNQKKINDNSSSISKDMNADSNDPEEPDFWIPPVGSRWDFDDGTDRWDSLDNSDNEVDDEKHSDEQNEVDDSETGELVNRTKRMSIVVGPSSFASRKKKKRTTPSKDE